MIITFIQIVNFFNNLSKQKILAKIEIAEDNYYETLVISTETGFEIHLKRSVQAHVNNYNPFLLKVWEANSDKGRRKLFYGGSGGDVEELSKNVGHQNWLMTKNFKIRLGKIP